jgi:hypothetical protein
MNKGAKTYPGKTGDDKNKHDSNEKISFRKKQHSSPVSAYGHGMVKGSQSLNNNVSPPAP